MEHPIRARFTLAITAPFGSVESPGLSRRGSPYRVLFTEPFQFSLTRQDFVKNGFQKGWRGEGSRNKLCPASAMYDNPLRTALQGSIAGLAAPRPLPMGAGATLEHCAWARPLDCLQVCQRGGRRPRTERDRAADRWQRSHFIYLACALLNGGRQRSSDLHGWCLSSL